MKVLIRFAHGLGDAVQLTCVLQHLRKHRPDWVLSLWARRGKQSVGHGYCAQVWHDQEPGPDHTAFDHIFNLAWYENYNAYGDCPNTKVTNCLREVFGIEPDPELLRYHLHLSEGTRQRTADYLQSIGARRRENSRFNAVAIHYEGNTSKERKDIDHDTVRALCAFVIELGHVPVILDWDRRSPLPDQRTIFNPGVGPGDLWGNFGSGDAEAITALISQCALFVGIDSGPQKCAGATDTPSLGVWTKHLPVQFFDLSPNFVHLVPADWTDMPPANHAQVAAFMRAHYQLAPYQHLTEELIAQAGHLLTGEPAAGFVNRKLLRQLTSTAYDRTYYEEHRRAGLDYLGFGDWQRQYGRWLVEALGWKGRHVLDVGCACGSIVRGLGEAGAYVQGVDLSEHMVRLGKTTWPDMEPILHVCDTVNLHLYRDGTWDAIHSAQVAEHWRPELVPFILRELWRVTKPGGMLVVFLDTEELCQRQGRDAEQEDPTHLCIRPLAWWHERLAEADWQVVTEEVAPLLRQHPDTFLGRYDWDWFVARREEKTV